MYVNQKKKQQLLDGHMLLFGSSFEGTVKNM